METHNRNSDEIDLAYFFRPLGKGLRKINTAFGNYLDKLGRNLFLFIFIFLVIAALGYCLRYILPKSYSANAVFVSYNLPAGFCSEMVNNLNGLIKDHENASILATELTISPAQASSIRSVSSMQMDSITTLDREDTTASAFKIRLIVGDYRNIPDIQKGLENYLENNSFARKRKEAHLRTLTDLRSDLLTRINNLDSLKAILSRSVVPRSSGQGIILGEPVSPIQAYQVQRDYFKQLKDIEEKLSLLRNVEVVQPFLQISTPNYPNFSRYFLISLIIGLAVALILTPLFGWR
jgi:hypothetical protein